jgi:hypothetical protein
VDLFEPGLLVDVHLSDAWVFQRIGQKLGNAQARLDLSVSRFRLPHDEVIQELHEISDATVFSRNIETSTPPGSEARVDRW